MTPYGINPDNLHREARRERFPHIMQWLYELGFVVVAVLIFWAAVWWLIPNGVTT